MSSKQDIRKKLEQYGVFLGYSLIGMAGLAYFSFHLMTSIQANKQNLSKEARSRLPQINVNWGRLSGVGLLALGLYGYGFYKIVKGLPENQTDQQKGDYALLSDANRFDENMQNQHIYKTMKFFGVSEHLIQKTRKQFQQMNPNKNDKTQKVDPILQKVSKIKQKLSQLFPK